MYQLDPHDISFPDPALYNPEEGLMAFGGDLSVERIWFAYQLGIFPWFNEGKKFFGGVRTRGLFCFLMK